MSTRERTEDGDVFPLPEIDANGVDRSQIRRMLERTPAERLRFLEAALAAMMEVRNGIGSAAVPRDPDLPR